MVKEGPLMNPTSGCGGDQNAHPRQRTKEIQCGTESDGEGQQKEEFNHQNRQSRSTVLRQTPYVVEHLAHSPGGSFPMVPFNLTWCATKQASQTTIRSLKGDTCCKKFIQEMGKLALVPAGKKRTQERSGRWSHVHAKCTHTSLM